MFKISDKVKCIKLPHKGQYQLNSGEKAIGLIYKIRRLSYSNTILELYGEDGLFNRENFEKVNDPKTELEFLDAFQENFKEGV